MAQKFLNLVSGILTQIEALVTSAGAGDAGKIPALDSSGRLDSSVLPVGVGVLSKSIVTSENLAARDMVNLYDDSGTLKARKADANNSMPAHGYVTAAATSPAAATVYFDGIISGFTGLTPGARYYLSETAGEVDDAAPSSGGAYVQYIGVALSATEIEFDPADFVVLA